MLIAVAVPLYSAVSYLEVLPVRQPPSISSSRYLRNDAQRSSARPLAVDFHSHRPLTKLLDWNGGVAGARTQCASQPEGQISTSTVDSEATCGKGEDPAKVKSQI